MIDTITTSLVEGVELIQSKYPFYDRDRLRDDWFNEKYSVQMIQNSLKNPEYMRDILKMIIFDCLIGNSDRHHSNWGELSTVTHNGDYFVFHFYIAPLYDNGSSLCAYVNESEIEQILNDKMRFESLVDTKSKSAIGWNDIRPIRHFELIKQIKSNYYDLTEKYVKIIKSNITDATITKVLNEFDNNIISLDMKKLLFRFIIERKNRILEIYDMKDEV